MSFTLTATSKADLLAQVEDLTGGTVDSGGSDNGGNNGNGGNGGGSTPPPATGDASKDPNDWSDEKVAAKFYPADPAMALYPSPENATIYVDTTATPPAIRGVPYIKDAHENIWKFITDANGNPVLGPTTPRAPQGYQAVVNGIPVTQGTGLLKLMIAQGEVYHVIAPGGQIQRLSSPGVPGSGTANVQLPPDWTDLYFGYKQAHGIGSPPSTGGGGGGGNTGGVPMPPDPPAPAVIPGSNGVTKTFGQGGQFPTISAALATASPGDTVAYAAGAPRGVVFAESFDIPEGVKLDGGGRWKDPTMKALDDLITATVASKNWAAFEAAAEALYTPGAIVDGSTLSDPNGYAHQLGGLIPNGNTITMGFRVKGFGNAEPSHSGTGGIRARGNMIGQMKGSENFISQCQNGIGPGGTQIINGPWDNTLIYNCGLSDGAGGAHNVYDTYPNCVRAIIGNNFFSILPSWPKGDSGHPYKTRAAALQFTGYFRFVGSDSSALDIPNGSTQLIDIPAGKIEQLAGALNHTLIGYAVENQLNGVIGVKTSGVTLIASCDNPVIMTNGPVDITNSTQQGNPITKSGSGTLTGNH